MKRFLRSGILQDLLWVAVGVFLLFWPAHAAKVLCFVLGAVLLLQGVVQCVGAFRRENSRFYTSFGLLSGVVALGVGFWLLFSPDTAKGLLPVLIAVVLLLHALQDCAAAAQLWRAGFTHWWICLVLGLLALALGVLILWQPGFFADILLVLTGASLIYDAVSDFWIRRKLLRWVKAVEDAVN